MERLGRILAAGHIGEEKKSRPNYWRCARGTSRQAGRFRLMDSVGETPTDAVETTALPKKSLLVGELRGRRTNFFKGGGAAL